MKLPKRKIIPRALLVIIITHETFSISRNGGYGWGREWTREKKGGKPKRSTQKKKEKKKKKKRRRRRRPYFYRLYNIRAPGRRFRGVHGKLQPTANSQGK
jgi:hypothetical protein